MDMGPQFIGPLPSEAQIQSLIGEGLAKGLRIEIQNDPISFRSYQPDLTTKRQFFWLSWMSRYLAGLPGQSNILDIGSNIEWVIGLAAHHQVTVLDVRSHPLADVFPFTSCVGSATDLPFASQAFDVVTFPQLLHWVGTGAYGDEIIVDGDLKMLSEIGRVLKNDGRAVFSTFLLPDTSVMKIRGRRLFSVERLFELISEAKLEFVDFKIFNTEMIEIDVGGLPSATGDILVPGNPDEDLGWVVGMLAPKS